MKMGNDKLKDYIKHHRQEFEEEGPPKQIWEALDKRLPSGSAKVISWKRIVPQILKIAASVFILLSVGAGMGVYFSSHNKDLSAIIHNPTDRREFQEATSYFTSQIDSKLLELKQYEPNSTILEDFNQIDQVSSELKLEMLKNTDQDQDILIKQMMRQYQQKLNVLNKILEKLQESKQSNLNKTEKKLTDDTLRL